MSDVKVVNPFESKSLNEINADVRGLHDTLDVILKEHTDAETGDVKWHDIKGDQARDVFDINQKMTLAQKRVEELLKLKGAHETMERLQAFMNTPDAPAIKQPREAAPTKRLRSLGQEFIDSDAFKRVGTDNRTTPELGFDAAYKAVLGEDDTLVDVDDLFPVESTRIGVVVDELFQPNNIAPLIPTIPTTQPAIKFLRETVNAQAAAEVNEGALSPEASIDWAEDMVSVEKIAVAHALTEELAADANFIRAVVNGRLRLFVNNREDLQILQGDGVSPNLRGILNVAGISNQNVANAGTAQVKLEAIHQAKTQVMTSFSAPTAVIGTATTWESHRLSKDGNLNYLLGSAGDSGEQRVWGLPFVTNENMAEFGIGNVTHLVGDFRQGANIFRRQDVGVSITDSHADEFMRGILRVRLTTRLALVVWRASAFCTITET